MTKTNQTNEKTTPEKKNEADEQIDGSSDSGSQQGVSAAGGMSQGNQQQSAPVQDLSSARTANIEMILDIPVQLTVELGRAKMPIRDLLKLAQGSVIELDGLAGDPMKIYANGCLIAKGEVIVMHDRFGIRLSDVVSQHERLHSTTQKNS